MIAADIRKEDKFFLLLNFSIPCLMACYIFVNPFSMPTVMEFCYYLSILALMVLLVFKKTEFSFRTPLMPGIALFFLWAVLGLFFTLDFSNTLHDLRAFLLEYLIVFYLLINFYQSRQRLEMISVLVIVSATIFSVGGMTFFYFIQDHAFYERFGGTFTEMFTGFMCFTTVFGTILSLRGMYDKAGKMTIRLAYFSCYLILSVATILNQSRSAIIGLFAALVIMSLYRKKTILLIIVTFILIVSLPGVKDRIGSDIRVFKEDVRLKMFLLSWEVIKDYPVAGVGYGGQIYGNKNLVDLGKYNARLPEKYQQKNTYDEVLGHFLILDMNQGKKMFNNKQLAQLADVAKKHKGEIFIVTSTHNMFLDIAIRTGLVGLALFGLIILTAAWMLWDVFRRQREDFFRSWSICLFACLAAYLSQAVFNDALYGTQGVLMYVNLAMIGILWNLARKNQPEHSGAKT